MSVIKADTIVCADLDVQASLAAAEETMDQDVLAVPGRHHRRKPEIASKGIEHDLLARSHELALQFVLLSPEFVDLTPQPTLRFNDVVCDTREQQHVGREGKHADNHVQRRNLMSLDTALPVESVIGMTTKHRARR